MADLVAELEGIARLFDREGVEFALCGGLAVAVHGHVRSTKDIDLLLPTAARDAAITALSRLGVETVGARHHTELWVPADELEALNDAIVGPIEVVARLEPGASEQPADD